MKTKLKIISAIIFICVLGYLQQKQKATQNDILLLNVEALAQNEGSNARCAGRGSVNCPINNDKVYFIY